MLNFLCSEFLALVCRQLAYHWPYRGVTYAGVLLLALERYAVVVNPNMCLSYRSFMSLFKTKMSL